MLALAVAWMACVDDLHVSNAPRFRVDGGETLDIQQTANLLDEYAKPIWLSSVQSAGVLNVSAQNSPPRELGIETSFVHKVLTTGPADQRRVLVVAGRLRFRASPADLDAAANQYRILGPVASACDYVDSGFVEGLELLRSELHDVAEVLVLGRATDEGWELPVVPSARDETT